MRRIILPVLLCLLLAGSALADGKNLLINGGFEDESLGRPTGWTEDMWLTDVGASYLELREDGVDGGLCAMIENVDSNDARFIQRIEVEPDTVYHFGGWVKAEGIPETAAGASLSVIGAFASFPELRDTAGEWVYLEYWMRTAETQHELYVGPRLGDYSADNTGKAYFDELTLSRDDNPPAGVDIIQLVDYASVNQQIQAETAYAEEASQSSGILPGLIAFVAALLILWMARMHGVPMPKAAIWIVLVLAAALRLYLMATQPGYEVDMNCFYAWSERMVSVGPNNFYQPDYFCDYPPGYLYLLWITGLGLRLFNVTGLDTMGRIIVKFVPMVADLAAVWLIWRLAKKHLGETQAVLLAVLYAVSPGILVDSAVWGQVDAVLAIGLLCTVALAGRGNWKAALPVYVVTVLMKPQALIAGPVGLAALVMDMLPWKDGGKEKLKQALIGVGISLAIAVAMLLPFLWGKENPIQWVLARYTESLGSYNYATLNTANLFYLLNGNWMPLESMLGPLSYGTWGTILMVIVVVGLIVVFIRRRDRELLPLFCALTYIGLYLFGVKMHERYLFPAFLLLLYAYIRKPDWRLLLMFAGFSVTFFANCALVLRDTHLLDVAAGSVLSVINLLLCGVGIWVALDKKSRPLFSPPKEIPKPDHLSQLTGRTEPMARMRRRDWTLMLGLTIVYAAIAYIGLGATVAPQTEWTSTGTSEEVIFDLGEQRDFEILFYAGINGRDHDFTLAFSHDGVDWVDRSPLRVTPGDCFRWQYATTANVDELGLATGWTKDPLICGGRYVRLSTDGPSLTLMEIVFRDLNGEVIPVEAVTAMGAREESAVDPWMLCDEPDTAPDYPSYYNGTYFDEIYHARTGYEHAHGMSTYEWTHPPLGKVLIMFAIKLFGMTPFGWRFMGTLMGVLMVPAMYMLGKVLFKKTRYAFLAAFVMAFDMMHLTQTRIATIDSYAVLFIILMYLCMFRYMQMSFFRDGWRTLIPLGFSGLFMGLGCASKWICMYAGVGLAVLFAWSMVQRFLEWRAARAAGDEMAERVAAYPRYLAGTLGACLLFFVAIPFAIYYFSYIPQFAYEGGLTWQRFWDTQVSIFNYHANLVDDHAFKSPWYEWPLMLKPMYYFDGKPYVGNGMISTIMCMGNPAVWWVGFAAFLYVCWRWMKPHLRGERQTDRRLAMILLAFAAQFLPWVIVPRSTFIYHYFGSLPFVMLCIVYAFEQLYARREKLARTVQGVYMAIVVVLFIGFYPIATGVPVPIEWAQAMNWLGFLKLPGWKFRGWLYF